MDVNGPSPIRPSIPIQPAQQAGPVQETTQSEAVEPKDDVDISPAARMMFYLYFYILCYFYFQEFL